MLNFLSSFFKPTVPNPAEQDQGAIKKQKKLLETQPLTGAPMTRGTSVFSGLFNKGSTY